MPQSSKVSKLRDESRLLRANEENEEDEDYEEER